MQDRYGSAVMQDRNATAQTWSVCSKGITQFYLPPTHEMSVLPAAGHHHPLAGTYFAYPRRDGQAELTWVAGYIPG